MNPSLRPLKWYERCQFEAGIHFQLFPNREVFWKSWFFDPTYGITWPGEGITSRWQLPESSSFNVDTFSVESYGKMEYRSRVFWLHGAIRILGLDLGAGFYYRTKPVS